MFNDSSLQVHERWDPGAAGPGDPDLESFLGLVVGQLEDQPQALLE